MVWAKLLCWDPCDWLKYILRAITSLHIWASFIVQIILYSSWHNTCPQLEDSFISRALFQDNYFLSQQWFSWWCSVSTCALYVQGSLPMGLIWAQSATTQLQQTVATLRNKQWYWDLLPLSPPCSSAQCQHHVSGHTRTLPQCPHAWWHCYPCAEPPRTCSCCPSDLGCSWGQSIFQTMESELSLQSHNNNGMWLLLGRVYQWKALLSSTAAYQAINEWDSHRKHSGCIDCCGPELIPRVWGLLRLPEGSMSFTLQLEQELAREDRSHSRTQSLSSKTNTVSVLQSLWKHILTIPVFPIHN